MSRQLSLFDYLPKRRQSASSQETGVPEELESVMDVYSHLLPLQAAFPTLTKLLRIALTLAVSTAHCERSFSALEEDKNTLKDNYV